MKLVGRLEDEFELSTGKLLYANAGILGINGDQCVTYGYDGSVCRADGTDGMNEVLTAAERVEIADWAIAQWTAFREKALAPSPTPEANG